MPDAQSDGGSGLDRIQSAIAVLRGEDISGLREAIARTWAVSERYCITSGRAVRMIPGDRCSYHGDAAELCVTELRPARCQHPILSPNHPCPHCSECGRDLPEDRNA